MILITTAGWGLLYYKVSEIKEENSLMEDIILVRDLIKRYKELPALNHFDLSIKRGEIYGLLGQTVRKDEDDGNQLHFGHFKV